MSNRSCTIGPSLILVGVVGLVGCAHTSTFPPPMGESEYRLGREDVVSVEVWKDPALSAKVPVRPDGKISLPMIGDLAADGRTVADLKQDITARLRPLVEDPVVTVMVSEVNAARVYIIGEVAHPGAYPARGVLTVLEGLALAGGPTEFARTSGIVVIRNVPHGAQARYRVNYNDIVTGRAPAMQLAAGDTIFVP